MRLVFEGMFDAPIEDLFAFHEDPANLARLLGGWPGFRLVKHDGSIRPGSRTRVVERLGPIPIAMTFEHFLHEAPRRFGERQIRGPFSRFEHVHEFEPVGTRTRLRDVLDVDLPWYLGGAQAVTLLVAPRLGRFFDHRHRELARLVREGEVGRAAP